MRADQLLVDRGLAASRSQAQRLITSGVQWRVGATAWQRVAKNGDVLPPGCEVQLLDNAESRYVSRGGLKLEGALRDSGLSVSGMRCLDVGQSTGGFTDCLLQHEAAQVVGLDVGHGQLHPSLRSDPRVVCVERINARELAFPDERIPEAVQGFDLIVGDLSFISLTLVLPALLPMLQPAGYVLMLVKPQFELQPGDIGKGGLVKDPASYPKVEARLRKACADLGLNVLGYWPSAIAGGDGNKEFWIGARRDEQQSEH
ncbi:hemolysin [Limnohabitans sp. JirII-29]|uniref:TlyA family RNA methyltransferase n=1 Tax=unclassified Limnohabitans TaxID=2626134 RepID=UPI000C1E5610|nr:MULTISPECIES: TlyA family RNA methyltransferase [unclassified Limnohabitans]PIT76026.1 hemolysin [Limnohabitans sp. JirII-31]PUE24678.1 hemolysin [Limnohabitans sp. JirII-29]